MRNDRLPATNDELVEDDHLRQVNLQSVLDGKIYVVRSALQTLELFEPLHRQSLAAARGCLNDEECRQLQQRGFEAIHEFVSPAKVKALMYALTAQLRPFASKLIRQFRRRYAAGNDRIYAPNHLWVRVMIPERCVAKEPDSLAGHPGHLVVHDPHRDSWFSHCLNSVNLWAAMGPVSKENSVLIYPDAHGAHIRRTGRTVNSDARIGRPVAFDLQPGDLICFHGEHVHSSALNTSDETRFAVSARFSVGPPRYGRGMGWTPYIAESWIDRSIPGLGTFRSRAQPAYVRHLLQRFRSAWLVPSAQDAGAGERLYQQRKFKREQVEAEIFTLIGDLLRELPEDSGADACETLAREIGMTVGSVAEKELRLAEGEVCAVSDRTCLVRSRGEIIAVARYCPHHGADLSANGYLQGTGWLRCGWHEAQFCARTGEPSCPSLPPLTLRPLARTADGKIIWFE